MENDRDDLRESWAGLMIVSNGSREEEHDNGSLGSAEARALWRQRQSKQNRIAHAGTEFLKKNKFTAGGRRQGRKIPGL